MLRYFDVGRFSRSVWGAMKEVTAQVHVRWVLGGVCVRFLIE